MADKIEVGGFFSKICEIFRIPELNSFQKDATKAYLEEKDVLVCSKTGSGKSVMYQATLIASNWESVIDSTYIGRDHSEDSDIFNGNFHYLISDYVYGSPEEFVGNTKWRDLLQKNQNRIACIAVDEAHTVVNWGEAQGEEDAFRAWFSKIGELRSLCPGKKMMALTATASDAKRKRIMHNLCMDGKSTLVLVDTPDRPNIKLSVRRVKATDSLSETFKFIVRNLGPSMDRQVIFCRTIRDCSGLFNTLKASDSHCCVEMYHSKTLPYIQELIRNDMASDDGNVRVLVCTNAAGMGVNFAGVHSVVNYGPPQDIDTFVQQIGRAGRDGSQSQHILIYNKRQLRKADKSMLNYLRNEDQCRREVLMKNYVDSFSTSMVRHLCCDICSADCQCGVTSCSEMFTNSFLKLTLDDDDVDDDDDSARFERQSTKQQRDDLRKMLLTYMNTGTCASGLIVKEEVLHGLSTEMVDEIVGLCDSMNCAEDIFAKTAVVSWKQASDIADIFAAVFPGSFINNGSDVEFENSDTDE